MLRTPHRLRRGGGGRSVLATLFNSPDFWAPLLTSAVLARGTGSPTFTRATVATVVDFAGKIRSVLSGEARFTGARRVRNKHPTTSEDFSNAAWTKGGGGGTITPGVTDPLGGATAYTFTATGANADLINHSTGTSGQTVVRNSIWIRRRTGVGSVQLFKGDGATQAIAVTAAWQRMAADATTMADGTHRIGVRLVTSGDAVDVWHSQGEDVTDQANQNPSEYVSVGALATPFHGAMVDGVKYFAFQNGNTVASNVVTEAVGVAIPSATLKRYRCEPASTNLVLQSENFGTTWAAVGSPTRSAAATRCGDVVLDRIGDDAAGTLEGYSQAITFTGNAVKAVSLFVKAGTSASTVIRLRDSTAPADRLIVTLAWAGGVPTPTATTGTVLGTDALADGVYRIRMATTTVTAANVNTVFVYPATDAAFAVANTGDVDAGGVQAENSTFCASYIPTTTATVTRNADFLRYAGLALPAAGTVYFEFQRTTLDNVGNGRALALTDGTANEKIEFPQTANTAAYALNIIDGGALSVAVNFGDLTVNTRMRLATRFAVNNVNMASNGTLGTADTTATMPTTTQVEVGCTNNGAAQLNCNVGDIRIWQAPLADGTLVAMSGG